MSSLYGFFNETTIKNKNALRYWGNHEENRTAIIKKVSFSDRSKVEKKMIVNTILLNPHVSSPLLLPRRRI